MTAAEFPTAVPPPSLPEDERSLWSLVAAGDRRAADRLVEVTYRRIWASLYKLTGGDADLAADLTQETYRKAWAALARFNGRSRFSTWVYRIAYNTFLNHVQRRRDLTALDEHQAERLSDPAPSPGQEALASSQARELRAAVLALPDDLRLAVTAHYWAEMPVKEVARLQGITPMGVRKRLKRARRRIEQSLKERSQ